MKKPSCLRMNNTAGHGVSGNIRLKGSDDMIAAGANTEITVIIEARQKARPGTYIITADTGSDHELSGEYPQGYITMDE